MWRNHSLPHSACAGLCAVVLSLPGCGAPGPTVVDLSIPRARGEERPEIAILEVEYMQDYILQWGVHLQGRPIPGEFIVFDPRAEMAALPVLSDPTGATLLVPGRMPARLPKWPSLSRRAPPTLVTVAWPPRPARREDAVVRHGRFGPGQPGVPDAAFTIADPGNGSWRPVPSAGWTPYGLSGVPEHPAAGPWRTFDIALSRPVPGTPSMEDFVTVFAVRRDPTSGTYDVLWVEQRLRVDEIGIPEAGHFGLPVWPGMGSGRVVDARTTGR